MEFDIEAAIENGDIEVCPCGAYNAYSWNLANMEPYDNKRDVESELKDISEDIYHIPCASGFEWQCGRCRAHLIPIDSPLNHPAYTHEDYN